jgi:outer membrane protein assembly factor BamB
VKSFLFAFAALAVSWCIVAPVAAQAENWPCFRGPTRQGRSEAKDLPLTWSATENIKWKSPVPGEGWSSPIVWQDTIFLTSTEESGLSCRVLCFDATTGGLRWNREVFRQETARKESRNSYATPTPATDGRRVYAVFGSGGIAAVDFDGKVEWTFREFQFYSRHGLGASPLLEDGLLVMPWDWSTDPAKEGAANERVGWQLPWDRSFVFALDAVTGKLKWKNGRGMSRIAHITPNIWIDETGRKQVVSGAGDVLQGFDLKTGERLWSARNEGEGVTPSVVIAGDIAVQANGWGGFDSVRAFKLKGAKGELPESAVVWEQKKNAPKLPSMIYMAPHIFCITEAGMAWCANAATGEVAYRERLGGTFAASPIAAGGRIYITADNGETVVLPAAPRFEILAKSPLGEKVQASPAVAADRLFIRGEKTLFCIGK